MSKLKKGLSKIGKKVGGFFQKHWKKIAIAALIVFSAGIATVGVAGFAGAMSAAGGGVGGFFAATGSTMWAGATAMAGTVGIGSGASGAAATAAGMKGATLMTGAAAQGLGLASSAAGTAGGGAAGAAGANVGIYTGPGSSFMGGGGSMFGGGAEKFAAQNVPQIVAGGQQGAGVGAGGIPDLQSVQQAAQGAQHYQNAATGLQSLSSNTLSNEAIQTAIQSGQTGGSGGLFGGQTMGQTVAQAAIPSALQMGGQYLMAKGQQEMYEDMQPSAMWGVDIDPDSDTYLQSAGDPFANLQPFEWGQMQPGGPRYSPQGIPGPVAPNPNYNPGLLGG